MDNKKPQEYIANIAKASSYFAFKNGPIKDLCKEGKISEEEMASCTGVTVEHYRELEAGNEDFSFTFIYKCFCR